MPERCRNWLTARKEAKLRIDPEQSHYRKEIEEHKNQEAASAEAEFHQECGGIQSESRPLQLEENDRETRRDRFNQQAGDEPVIEGDVAPTLDIAVAAIAAIVEFGISMPVLLFLNMPVGLAIMLASGFSLVTLWLGHRFGAAVRKQVKSRLASNLFVIVLTLGCAVPLALALTRMRHEGLENSIKLQQAIYGSSTHPASAAGPTAGSEALFLLLVTLSMFFLTAVFRFEVEYAGARFGLRRVERELLEIKLQIKRLEERVDALSTLYQVICSGIDARFRRLDHAYLKTHSHYTARLGRAQDRRKRCFASPRI
jgi:hypothetical protein